MLSRFLLLIPLLECAFAQFSFFDSDENIFTDNDYIVLRDNKIEDIWEDEEKTDVLKANDDDRIVGGYITYIQEHPHQVSLRYKGRHICGGSIISEEWIVTAAHCVDKAFAGDISIKAGSSTITGSGDVVDASEIIVHENYGSSDYDVAVIKLEEPLQYKTGIGSIALPSSTENYFSGTKATVTGWGTLRSSGSLSNHLREVEVPLVTSSKCAQLYGRETITRRMICAGFISSGGKDACQGDSGGPLVQNEKLIGIVSWGYGCAKPKYPGVYTRVTAVRSWIHEQTGL